MKTTFWRFGWIKRKLKKHTKVQSIWLVEVMACTCFSQVHRDCHIQGDEQFSPCIISESVSTMSCLGRHSNNTSHVNLRAPLLRDRANRRGGAEVTFGTSPSCRQRIQIFGTFQCWKDTLQSLPSVLTERFAVEVSSWPAAVCGSNQKQCTTDLSYPCSGLLLTCFGAWHL